jgi:uncharacterized protein (TIGR04255 family)
VISDKDSVFAVHAALEGRYPKIDENAVQDFGVLPGPSGLQAVPGEATRGWRFRSNDEMWTVVIMPGFFALETTGYDDWTDFSSRLANLVGAVETHLQPSLERRLGIRYVTKLREYDVSAPTDWIGKVEDHLLGPIHHPEIGPGVTSAQALVQIKAPGGYDVLFRYGCLIEPEAGGKWIYLLDSDCFRESGRPFASAGILADAEEIHTIALQIFQSSLTPEYFGVLHGDVEEDS